MYSLTVMRMRGHLIIDVKICLCLCFVFSTTEQVFVPSHLSRLPLGPGQKMAFVPGPTASRASGGDGGLLSRLETPTGTKGPRPPRWPG